MEKSTFSAEYKLLVSRMVELRENADMTQRELAQRLDVPRSFVSRVEQGERRVDLVEFFWICEACGSSPEQTTALLYREIRKGEKKGVKKAKRGTR